MTIEKNWIIEQLTTHPELSGEIDVVVLASWRINGTDGLYNATTYGSTELTYTQNTPYTPYESLTEYQVIDWVKTALGIEQVLLFENRIDDQISAQINPIHISLQLPWNLINIPPEPSKTA